MRGRPRKTDRKRNVTHRIDPAIAARFRQVCLSAGVPQATIVESLMEYFISLEAQVIASPDQQTRIQEGV